MKRPLLILAAALVIVGAVGWYAYARSRPVRLDGEAWTYTLAQADLPDGWQVGGNQLQTAYDLQHANPPGPADLTSVYSIEFSRPDKADLFDITAQVLIYASPEAATKAFAAENPGAEWESIAAPTSLGDGTAVWRLKPVADAPQQASYRVDFRYLNGVGSVGVVGTSDKLLDASAAYGYASKILSRMQNDPAPAALKAQGSGPDLRGLLLSQTDLARLDTTHGEQWEFNSVQLPGWTPNSAFADPGGMDKLGRLMGYQAWLIKPLADKDLKTGTGIALFEQVSVYTTPDQAKTTMQKMTGLQGGEWPKPPAVGESSRAWTQVLDSQNSAVGPGALATTAINFQSGVYTGSIQLQSAPVKAIDINQSQALNQKLAEALAAALADKLKNAGK